MDKRNDEINKANAILGKARQGMYDDIVKFREFRDKEKQLEKAAQSNTKEEGKKPAEPKL